VMQLNKDFKKPYLLVEKAGEIRFLTGTFLELPSFQALEDLRSTAEQEIAFVIPFSAAGENGMETKGEEPLLAIQVSSTRYVSEADLHSLVKDQALNLDAAFQPSISDKAFAEEVTRIQEEEIARGNACQVIYSRRFEAQIHALSPLTPLVLFTRLLKQVGQYLTFLFSDGKGHYFVGASPERQLEIHDELVIKNPISGTMPKNGQSDFPERLEGFLQDQKEINELSQILDEELKIMSQICPRGGKISGPFLREAGQVIHTEYHLAGHSKKSAVTALRISLHAPTLVGSPLESAFRIIAAREPDSRRYYGGEIGILETNGDMYSAIMIRTAEIFSDGLITIQSGAGIVRDSDPQKEAEETSAKAAGLIQAILGNTKNTGEYLSEALEAQMEPALKNRNTAFSRFHFEDQIGHRDLSNLHQESITIINNEDNFAFVLSHITRYLGYKTTIVDTFDYDLINDVSDLVVLGPGPGDINDPGNPRMKKLLKITADLAHQNIPTLGICLGIQAMAKHMGMPVQRQHIPTQGLQEEIDLFGRKERVGMYNSFSPVAEHVPANFEVCVNRENRVMALRSENIYGFQFHVESAMTENGLQILTEALDHLMGVREKRMLSFESFVEKSISGDLNIEAQKEFLLELNQRGFSGNDIADLVRVFYKQMPTELDLPGAIDLCGTGGSGLARINTSTLSAILVASSGIPVAKHGNKAASGRFGSFDLLEAIGINIMADKSRLEHLYSELNLAFIFARTYHPVFKHFAAVRQELKTKTIFNLLGPLLNPAKPDYQIIGTSSLDDMNLMIEAARALGKKKVMVLTGADGLDELTLTGETIVMTLENGVITRSILTPSDFGLEAVSFDAISGGSADFNIRITEEILSGTCKTSHLDLVLANTALALKFMGRAVSYLEGMDQARQLLQGGGTKRFLERYTQMSTAPDILMEIVKDKRIEIEALKKSVSLSEIQQKLKPSNRDFKAALGDRKQLGLIAEIKRSSPSEKEIHTGHFDPGKIASIYETAGADAISVLTDEKHFRGALKFLEQARTATRHTPLLMKDFFIDEYQIYLARRWGADAILLITAILSDEEIQRFTKIAETLNMDVLLEVHTNAEMERALRSSAQIIGVNNRDLHSFSINTKTAIRLGSHVPETRILVAESGYSPGNTAMAQGFANAVLVGSSIMKSPDMSSAVQQIKTARRSFKACGIRTPEDARFCEEIRIPFVGLNFVPTSKRCISLDQGRALCGMLKHSLSVGVFQNYPLEEVQKIADDLDLDMVQLAGDEDPAYCGAISQPVIKTLKEGDLRKLKTYEDVVVMFIIDGAKPGSGAAYEHAKLQDIKTRLPFLVAGGVHEGNVADILRLVPQALGVDVASGLEIQGRVDQQKINNLATLVAGATV
jgi:phenazine biosynthesis protein phzE